jgi:hypothetical protein
MNNKITNETLTLKRFVIRKTLIGKNVIITFTNKKKEQVSLLSIRHILTQMQYQLSAET